MTIPFDMQDMNPAPPFMEESIEDMGRVAAAKQEEFKNPKAIMRMSTDTRKELSVWLSDQLTQLTDEYEGKREEWARYEHAYKAYPEVAKSIPFIGASTDNIPLIASMVDPVHARLETGIFRQSPPFTMTALRKSMMKYEKPLQKFVNFYMKNIIDARKVASPRLLELAKLGTAVFYIDYRIDKKPRMSYIGGKAETEMVTNFQGPVLEGVDLGDFLFPALYQDVQACPLVARRIRTTIPHLNSMARSGWLVNVDKVTGFGGRERTTVEEALEDTQGLASIQSNESVEIVIYEVFFRYDVGDGVEQMMRAVVHMQTSDGHEGSPLTILQLRPNDAWHGKYPFVLMNYTINNNSLLGTGLCEMVYPFQESVKRYHQLAQDNAFIANAKMFIAKRGIPGLEGDIKVYAGRTIYTDNPGADLIPLSMGDIYPSTLTERQNLLGLAEKRTGVSDYMVGRESPIVGSRATATSTLALIQEGTKRVEQVMENIRVGWNEIHEMFFHLWAQHGTWDLNEIQFGDEEDVRLVEEFFTTVAPKARLTGAFSINIGVTDATTNKQVQQQMQLALINVIQGYLKQLLEMGQLVIQTQGIPQFVGLVKEVIESSTAMYRDLLSKYDIPNSEEYLPDVLDLLASVGAPGAEQGGTGGTPPGVKPDTGLSGMDDLLAMVRGSTGQPPQGVA